MLALASFDKPCYFKRVDVEIVELCDLEFVEIG
jgi:hypothetical protein